MPGDEEGSRRPESQRITLDTDNWTELKLPKDIVRWRLINTNTANYLNVSYNDTTDAARDEDYFQLGVWPRGTSILDEKMRPDALWVKRNTANTIYFEYWTKEE